MWSSSSQCLKTVSDEPAAKFVSWLKGQSNVCDFSIECPTEGCNTRLRYADKKVSHKLAGGLEDVSIQVRVLALAATEKKLDLTKIVEYVKAQETGTRSSKLIGSSTNICKLSDYKSQQTEDREKTSPARN